jgi:UDP-3-O-[3-hydroxymyristoyl] glucosamine N-acyltransferase
MSEHSFSLTELSQHLGAEIKGNADCRIFGIASLDKAQTGQISFLYNPSYKKYLPETAASAVIVSPQDVLDCQTNLLIMANPYLGYAKTAQLFMPQLQKPMGVHPSACVGDACEIAASASIGPNCVIGNQVKIGEGTVIGAGTVIGDQSVIGANCILWANVTLYHNVRIGDRVIIQSSAVIGSDGFGFAPDNGKWYKIPQLGGVLIGNDVEIGSNTSIDRGALGDTIIEDGVKLDNLIQIAHNVRICAHAIIAACTAIAGSTTIGKHCMIGGACSIAGHITLVDGVILTACTGVSNSVKKPGIYSSGLPLQDNRQWRRNVVRFQQLDDIAKRLRKLETSA